MWSLRPYHWFCGHLHVLYESKLRLKHDEDPEANYVNFTALDKPVPGKDFREFFGVFDIKGQEMLKH